MKKLHFYILLTLIVFSTSACYRTIEKMGNTNDEVVLAYPAVNQFNIASSGINYWNKALISPDLGKKTDTILLSLNIPRALKTDVTVNLGVDEAAVAAYNKDTLFGSTQYAMMPSNYYKIVTPTLVIPAGKTDTTIKVAINPSVFDISKTGYILPITITNANGVAVSPMRTVYLHIEKDPFPPYSQSGWTVAGFSSEEASGEGPNNGHLIHAFDNNTGTFWHTQWQDGLPGPPHWFAINMNASVVLNGIMFLDRQGVGSEGRPKNVTIEISNDGTTWSKVTDLTLADQNGGWQKFKFASPTKATKYFKVTVSSMYGGSSVKYTNLAEVKVF